MWDQGKDPSSPEGLAGAVDNAEVDRNSRRGRDVGILLLPCSQGTMEGEEDRQVGGRGGRRAGEWGQMGKMGRPAARRYTLPLSTVPSFLLPGT